MKNDKTAYAVVDLGFGDAGKGTIVDWLARTRDAHTVVRFNGGAQAGHNVVAPDGRHHTFSQFGSATFVPGVRTHLSRHMVVSPLAMLVEAKRLAEKGVADAFARTTMSAEALVVTPFQRSANRLREIARGDGRHGSCGMGIGETVSDSLTLGRSVVRLGDLADAATLRRKLHWLQATKREQMREAILRCRGFAEAAAEIEMLEDDVIQSIIDAYGEFTRQANVVADEFLGDILARRGDVLFEGAQGVLIDEWRGFHPYTTWSTCTFDNASALLDEHGYDGRIEKLGVVRAYGVRHGPGPFPTEDAELALAIPDMHNRMDDWQRNFRIGWFDAVATRYAIAACGGIDALAVTGLDRLKGIGDWRCAESYVLFPPKGVDASLFDLAPGRSDIANGIRLGPPRDLAYQQALTDAFAKVAPRYGPSTSSLDFAVQTEEHLGRIALALGAPVTVASFGPTADDKRALR